MLSQNFAVLRCHAEMASPAVHGIGARLTWLERRALAITFTLKGDSVCLRIPPPAVPRRANHLWRHTCFEAFARIQESPAYWEFNFSPSGEWAAYAFRDYRDGGPIEDDALDPKITVRSSAEVLELDAVLRLDRLPGAKPRAKLRLGLSAVVEDESGRLSYWALKHPPGKPDFHHPDAFAMELSFASQPS